MLISFLCLVIQLQEFIISADILLILTSKDTSKNTYY